MTTPYVQVLDVGSQASEVVILDENLNLVKETTIRNDGFYHKYERIPNSEVKTLKSKQSKLETASQKRANDFGVLPGMSADNIPY